MDCSYGEKEYEVPFISTVRNGWRRMSGLRLRKWSQYLAVRPTLCMYMFVSSGASTCTTQSMSGKSSPLCIQGTGSERCRERG